MDEPFPVRRAIVGFLLILGFVILLMALVRPAIFSLAPPRDDTSVAVGTAGEVSDRTQRQEILLSRSYGWAGERDAGDGRVQLAIIVGPTPTGIVAVNAASPVADDCDVEVGPDRLTDCEGRAWTFAGLPLEPGDPPLERFPIRVDGGSALVDFTRTIDQ